MEAACPLLRFVNYDEPKTKREKYKSHFKAKIQRFLSDKVIFILKRSILTIFGQKFNNFDQIRSISFWDGKFCTIFGLKFTNFDQIRSFLIRNCQFRSFSKRVNLKCNQFFDYFRAKNSFSAKNTDFWLLRSNRNSERRILKGHKTTFTENLIFKTFFI